MRKENDSVVSIFWGRISVFQELSNLWKYSVKMWLKNHQIKFWDHILRCDEQQRRFLNRFFFNVLGTSYRNVFCFSNEPKKLAVPQSLIAHLSIIHQWKSIYLISIRWDVSLVQMKFCCMPASDLDQVLELDGPGIHNLQFNAQFYRIGFIVPVRRQTILGRL